MRKPAYDLKFEQAALEACVAEWQEILRLRDWIIIVERTRRHALGAVAAITPATDYKEAVLKIADPVDAEFQADADLEHSIVHELLHLHYRYYAPATEAEKDEFEAAINLTAHALVSLKRGSRNA